MSVDKAKSVSEPIMSGGVFPILVAIGLLFLLVGYVQTRKSSSKVAPTRKAVQSDHIKVSPNFTRLKLPRRNGSWTIQLNPNRFSRKVYIPRRTEFTFKWEKNTPAQIKLGSGRLINVDHRTETALGVISPETGIQFRGQGTLTIRLRPI